MRDLFKCFRAGWNGVATQLEQRWPAKSAANFRFGSASKVLDNPYPLGGYTGIEFGLASEFIPVEDLASLGSKTTDKGEYNYYTLTLGKGLYYNVDMHAYFTPFGQAEKMQSYGAQIRWGFYEASFFHYLSQP